MDNQQFRKVMCIYKIVNKLNDKVYIGSTTNFYQRIVSHITDLTNRKHYNSQLQMSWDQSGKDNFYFEILEIVDDESFLPFAELYYIEKYRRIAGVFNINNPLNEKEIINSRMEKSKNKTNPKITDDMIRDTILRQFDLKINEFKESINKGKMLEFSKLSEYITKRLDLVGFNIKNVENVLIEILRNQYGLSVYNFESPTYDRHILNKYGIFNFKKTIISKDLAKKIASEMPHYNH
jgi:group I intron endonuclease